jgi:hypothetical protein
MPSHNLSGYSYVPMKMRDSDDSVKPSPTPIKSPARCGHVHEVCVDCLETWELDWIVYFRRTVGGRRLAMDSGRNPKSPTTDEV